MTIEIQNINEEIKYYAEEITQSMYRTFLGNPNKKEYAVVLEKFNRFFKWDIISDLRKINWNSDDDSRALYYLKGYMLGQWYSYKSKELMDKISQIQINKTIPWNNTKISIRESRFILNNINEPDYNILRKRVDQELNNVLYPVIYEYYNKMNLLSAKLEYSNFIEAANDLRRYRVQDLVQGIT